MTDGLQIQKISEDNFDEFIFLVKKLAEYEKLVPPDEGAIARLKTDGLSEKPGYEAYLGYIDGKAVAYIIYFFNYSSFLARPTLYLEDLFVLKEYRRIGFGTQLFNFCAAKARQNGCGRIELCVLTWNEPAIKFYEKNFGKRLDWYFYRLEAEQYEKLLK